MLGGCRNARIAGRYGKFCQGDQPPMRASPLAVWVASKAAVLLLPGEQRRHPRPSRDGRPVRDRVFVQQVATCQMSHRRLLRCEQPRHRARRALVHHGRIADHSSGRLPRWRHGRPATLGERVGFTVVERQPLRVGYFERVRLQKPGSDSWPVSCPAHGDTPSALDRSFIG
jgi:hypothetical protein